MTDIVGGYIGDDIEKAEGVLTYVTEVKNKNKEIVKKLVIGGGVVMAVGMILTFVNNAFIGFMYLGLAVMTFGGGMFVENFMHTKSVKTPTIIRKEAIEYIKENTEVKG